jgi:hypothetical protein
MAWEVDDLEETIAELRERGVIFEEYDVPGLKTVNGIAEVEGNYPSKGGRRGEGRLVQGQRGQPACHRSSRDLSTAVPRAVGGRDNAQRANPLSSVRGRLGPFPHAAFRRP